MKLLEFKIFGGSKISINPTYIVDIYPSYYLDKRQTSIEMLGQQEPINVDEDYKKIIEIIKEI